MRRFRLGLVVGKFSPLHLGHEALIASAAAQCDRLLLLSYSQPELPRCEAAQRRRWLTSRCPQHVALVLDDATLRTLCRQRQIAPRPLPRNDAPDFEQQTFLAWLLRELLQQRPDAMFCNEAYGPPCAALLSEALGQTVVAVMPDPHRSAHPVSGSAARAAPHAQRGEISAEVFADLLPRIALLGGESSGKTTLACALAEQLGVPWVPEFGRQWWTAHGGQLDADDFLHIARTQIQHEQQAAQHGAPLLLIGDTSPLTTLGYSLWTLGRAAPELRELAQRRYDALILCLGDFRFAQDGTRRDARFRAEQQAWYRAMLPRLRTPWIEVGGALPRRTARIIRFLRAQGLLR